MISRFRLNTCFAPTALLQKIERLKGQSFRLPAFNSTDCRRREKNARYGQQRKQTDREQDLPANASGLLAKRGGEFER